MRIAVFSDIHANINALEAVYEDAVDQDVEGFWFLGDVVGYGPDAVPAVKWLAHFVETDDWVLGNHEAIMTGLLTDKDSEAVSPVAKEVCSYHRQRIEDDEMARVFCQTELNEERAKPKLRHIDGIDHILTHAGQHARHLFRYIYPWQTEVYLPREFEWLEKQHQQRQLPQIQWFGHTHVPTLVYGHPNGHGVQLEVVPVAPCKRYSLLASPLMLINPGSVGQPRDLDRRAAYAIIDTDSQDVVFRRVTYAWRETLYELDKLALSLNTFTNLEERLRGAIPDKETPSEWLDHYKKAGQIDCKDYDAESLR